MTDLEALLAEVREHRDYLANRAAQLAVDKAALQRRIDELEARVASQAREKAGP